MITRSADGSAGDADYGSMGDGYASCRQPDPRASGPADCTDGFNEAYYRRPERLPEPGVRQACSAWSFADPGLQEQYVRHLALDLASGAWDKHHGSLRREPSYRGSLVLIRATPGTRRSRP